MEFLRIGVKLQLQLLAYATAISDLSCACDLYHSSWQLWILNPLIKAMDQTCNLMVPSWICFCCAMTGTPAMKYFKVKAHTLLFLGMIFVHT